MKRLLILMLVLGSASSANAFVVDLCVDGADTLAVTVTDVEPTVRISVYSDTGVGGNYSRVLTINDYGTISGIGP